MRNVLLQWLFTSGRRYTNFPRFQGAQRDHVRVQSSSCCFPRASLSFVRPRVSLSFDQWHLTRSPPIRKRICVGRYNNIILTSFIIRLAPRAGKMNQIARCDWLPERARLSCPLGTTRCIPKAKFPLKPYNKSFIDQVCSVKMAGYWPRSFLRVYGPRLRLGP